MNDLSALMGTSGSATVSISSSDPDDGVDSLVSVTTDSGDGDLQTAADQIKNDFGSFVDSVLQQYSQTASTDASSDFSNLVAMA
jgi:hypothetical protein